MSCSTFGTVEAMTKEEKFAKWVAKQGNKTYHNKAEWNARLANFEKSDAIIENFNWQSKGQAKKDPVVLQHNFTSDLDTAEYLALLGDADPADENVAKERRGNRKLQTEEPTYDSVDFTYVSGATSTMGPVRD